MIKLVSSIAAMLLILCIRPVLADSNVTESLSGDWAGWVYLDGGSDLPIQLHLKSVTDSTSAIVRLPSEEEPEFRIISVDQTDDSVTIAFALTPEREATLTARLHADTLTGAVAFGSTGASFQAVKSAVALPGIDPATYEDLVGIYRSDDGQGIIISRWFWGELTFTDLQTGYHATMFATTPDTFMAGPTQYSPAPIIVRAAFKRDADGSVAGVHWHADGLSPFYANAVAFVEDDVTFRNGDIQFSGTLIKPAGPGPHPAIVLLGGSGWRTRNYTRQDAQVLASVGVAALIYDKRGHGKSGGESTVPFDTTASDAIAAVEYLITRTDIDASRIGLSGTSRGGWFAPLAASKSDDISFLVLWVAPAVSPAEQETTRRMNILKATTTDPAHLALGGEYLEAQWHFARTGTDWDTYSDLRDSVFARGWDFLGGPETSDSTEWQWARYNMFYDPIPALEQVTVPVVAIFGERDENVVPDINVPLMRDAFARAGNNAAAIHVLPEANHSGRLVLRENDGTRIHDRRVVYAPGFWNHVTDWLTRQLQLARD